MGAVPEKPQDSVQLEQHERALEQQQMGRVGQGCPQGAGWGRGLEASVETEDTSRGCHGKLAIVKVLTFLWERAFQISHNSLLGELWEPNSFKLGTCL